MPMIRTNDGEFNTDDLLAVVYDSSKPDEGCTVYLNGKIAVTGRETLPALIKKAEQVITFKGQAALQATAQLRELMLEGKPKKRKAKGKQKRKR